MQKHTKKFNHPWGILLAGLLFLALPACEFLDDENKALDDALTGPGISPRPEIVHPDDKPYCYSETYFQPDAEITKKVDMLFIVDSSGSLSAEREAIGDGIDAFIDAMPEDVDTNFGVMMAHVGEDYSGSLYRYDNGLPRVLSTNDYSKADLRTILRTRMKKVKTEFLTDGGEMGLYSLNRALDEDKIAASQAEGFFRDDAALVVVFVADENDICARFPEGIVPVPDPNNKEIPAFNNYCGDVTSESTLLKLKEHQMGRPLLVGGILYHEGSDVPNGGENEIGYGYTDMIRMDNGVIVDLSEGRFHEGLDQIGTLVSKKILLITEYPLQSEELDLESLTVEVDGQPVAFDYVEETNEIHLIDYAGVENSEVYVSYCQPVVEELDPVTISNLSLTGLTSETVTFTWDTDQLSSSQLEAMNIGTGEVIASPISLEPKTHHEVTLSGLNPNTLYSVRALSGTDAGITASQRVTIRTRRAL